MSTPIINEDDSDVVTVIVEDTIPTVTISDDDTFLALIEGTPGPSGVQGPQGIQGIQGVKGDKGDPGDAVGGVEAPLTFDPDTGIVGIDVAAVPAAITYTFNQGAPATTWTIAHNMGVFPEAVIVDSAGNRQYGDIHYVNANTVQLNFSSAFSGTAYLI